MGLAYHENEGTGLIFNINWNTNSLEIYDADKGSLLKQLAFEVDGPNGAGDILGFHVHNPDSIFLFTQLNPVLVLTDTTGKIKSKLRYDVPDLYSPAFVHQSYFLSPPRVRGNELIVKTHVHGNIREMEAEQLAQTHLVYAINLTDGSTRFLNHTYPENYIKDGRKHIETSIATDGDKMVYSFFGDHNLYVADHSEANFQMKPAASKYLDSNLPYFPQNGDRLANQKYLMASSRYEHLIYDSYREIYYRFAYPTMGELEENELSMLWQTPGDFVIMILDKELNLLGETYFDGGKYFPNNVFVAKDGLYISLNHPHNPENIEDQMIFGRLKLSKKR